MKNAITFTNLKKKKIDDQIEVIKKSINRRNHLRMKNGLFFYFVLREEEEEEEQEVALAAAVAALSCVPAAESSNTW